MRLLPTEGGSRLFLFIEKLHRLIESSPRPPKTSNPRNLETSARRLVDSLTSLKKHCRLQVFAYELSLLQANHCFTIVVNQFHVGADISCSFARHCFLQVDEQLCFHIRVFALVVG